MKKCDNDSSNDIAEPEVPFDLDVQTAILSKMNLDLSFNETDGIINIQITNGSMDLDEDDAPEIFDVSAEDLQLNEGELQQILGMLSQIFHPTQVEGAPEFPQDNEEDGTLEPPIDYYNDGTQLTEGGDL